MLQLPTYLPHLCPKPASQVFEKSINHPDAYIWDAWSWIEVNGDINFFTLGSPRKMYEDGSVTLEERDHIPHHWRHFKSSDNGLTWQDIGPVMAPRIGQGLYDSRSIWTGAVCEYQGRVLAAYTGIRDIDDTHIFLQSWGLAEQGPDGKFYPLFDEAVSCPLRDYDQITKQGYYLGPKDSLGHKDGEDGGCILAWRDPGIVVLGDDIYAFWSAKSSLRKPQEPVLGFGKIKLTMDNQVDFELLPPIFLPNIDEFTQAEVPQIIYDKVNKIYYLMVSLVDTTQKLGHQNLHVRIYKSPLIDGAWQEVKTIIKPEDLRYPGVIVKLDYDQNNAVKLYFNGPYSRSAPADLIHTMPELSTVTL